MPNDYVILLRDPRSLALQAELPHYEACTWTRRDQELGEFEIDVAAVDVAYALIPRNTLVEIRRNGSFEFAGIMRYRHYDAIARTWHLKGPCLKHWLGRRTIMPPAGQEFDSVTNVAAETAMKYYITRNLTAPPDATRDVHAELSGLLFDVQSDGGRGLLVSFNGRYVNLLTGCLVPLAVAGGLWHDVVLQTQNAAYPGYRYEVYPPVDATAETGAVPVVFSTAWDNVGKLEYEEDFLNLTNAVYVLGQGQGAARAVRIVIDANSIAADFRNEASADSRNNAAATSMDQDGAAVIAQSAAATLRLDAEPLIVGPTLYRDAWDLGYDVTLSVPEVGIALDQRIVEVKVTLDSRQGEQVAIALGSTARTQARVISAALGRSNRVQVA